VVVEDLATPVCVLLSCDQESKQRSPAQSPRGLCPGRQYDPAEREHQGASSPPQHPYRRRVMPFLTGSSFAFHLGLISTPWEVIQRRCSWPPSSGRDLVGYGNGHRTTKTITLLSVSTLNQEEPFLPTRISTHLSGRLLLHAMLDSSPCPTRSYRQTRIPTTSHSRDTQNAAASHPPRSKLLARR
jgi:hypothetical protein